MIAFPEQDRLPPRRSPLPRFLIVDLRRTVEIAGSCEQRAAFRCYCHVLRRLRRGIHAR